MRYGTQAQPLKRRPELADIPDMHLAAAGLAVLAIAGSPHPIDAKRVQTGPARITGTPHRTVPAGAPGSGPLNALRRSER